MRQELGLGEARGSLPLSWTTCSSHSPVSPPHPGPLSPSLTVFQPCWPLCLSAREAHSYLGGLHHLFPLSRTLLFWMVTGPAPFCYLGLSSNVTLSQRSFQTTIFKGSSLYPQSVLHGTGHDLTWCISVCFPRLFSWALLSSPLHTHVCTHTHSCTVLNRVVSQYIFTEWMRKTRGKKGRIEGGKEEEESVTEETWEVWVGVW